MEKYNFKVSKFFIRCTSSGQVRHNRTNRKFAELPELHQEVDKPPDRYYPYPTRNAKFALLFTRGKFGVFYYELSREIYQTISGTSCRDPPSQSF